MAVVPPAGMAASTTETPVTSSAVPARRQPSSTSPGMSTRRTAEKYRESRSRKSRQFTSAQIIPMRNMERAVLQPPTDWMVLPSTCGSCHWVSISTSPMNTASMQGFPRTFFHSFWLLFLVKKPRPTVHMAMRWGVR